MPSENKSVEVSEGQDSLDFLTRLAGILKNNSSQLEWCEMWGQTEEKTAGRQLSYHCPAVVATLEQVQLFVSSELGCRETGRGRGRKWARNVMQMEYLSTKKEVNLRRIDCVKGEHSEKSWKVGWGGGYYSLTGNSNVLLMCSINQGAARWTAWQLLSVLIKVSTDIFCFGSNTGTSSC